MELARCLLLTSTAFIATDASNPFGFIATGGFKHNVDVNPWCYNGCPEDSPCFNTWTGLCEHKVCTTPTTAQDPEDSKDFSKSDLPSGDGSDDFAAIAAAHEPVCTCAGNTVLTSRLSVHSPVVLWVGFALLFIPGVYFVVNGGLNRRGAAQLARRSEAFLAGATCLISALAYLAMALGVGHIRRCDGRQVFWARGADWLFTCPLIIYQVLTFAGTDNSLTVMAIGVDILVLLSFFVSSVVDEGIRYSAWMFGSFFLMTVIWILATAPYMYTPARDLLTHGHLMEESEEESAKRLSAAREKGVRLGQLAKRTRLATHDVGGDDEELDHPSLSSAPSRSAEAGVINSWGKKVGSLMNKVQDAQSQVENVFDEMEHVLDVVPKSFQPLLRVDKAEDALEEAEKWMRQLAGEALGVLRAIESTLESLASWMEVGWEKWEGMSKLKRKGIKLAVRRFAKQRLRPVVEAFKLKLREWEAEFEAFLEDLAKDLLKKIGEWLVELIKEEVKDVLKELFQRVKDYVVARIKAFLKPILEWIAQVLLILAVDLARLAVDILLRPHGVVVENRTYSAIVWLTLAAMVTQPIVWVAGTLTGFLSVTAEAWVYLALDVTLKVGVSALIYLAGTWQPPRSEEGGAGWCPVLNRCCGGDTDDDGTSTDKVAVWQGAASASPARPNESLI